MNESKERLKSKETKRLTERQTKRSWMLNVLGGGGGMVQQIQCLNGGNLAQIVYPKMTSNCPFVLMIFLLQKNIKSIRLLMLFFHL